MLLNLKHTFICIAITFVAMLSQNQLTAQEKKIIRVGIIGTDTPHSTAFTKTMNDPNAPAEMRGCKVVAFMPFHSPDIPASVRYADKVADGMRKMNIKEVKSVEELLKLVDAVCVEPQDGRPHFKQAIQIIKAGKPLFIDKPVTGTLAETIQIYELAKKHNVPIFSSSSLRYTDGAKKIIKGSVGDILGCDTYSPAPLEEHHPDFFWYGIHGVEPLFTIMGTGCLSVSRTHSFSTDVATGTWKDGRIGTFRGRRGKAGKYAGGYGGFAFGTKGIADIGSWSGYEPLVAEIVKFFKTGKSPVSVEETLEIYAFMEAADESKRRGGKPVTLKEVMTKAKKAASNSADDSFSIILLPDTQFYSEKFPSTYVNQTEWIKKSAKKENIKFVVHLGDIVQNSTVKEFEVADKAHKVLDDVVPYSMVPGNHDMLPKVNKRLVRNTANYNKFFPPSRYKDKKWYGGHKGEKNDNNYCFFESHGMKFMVVSLEFAARDETIGWARNIISEHKDRKVIIATHCYMRPNGREKTSPRSYGIEGNSGEELWHKLVKKHDNIFMVVCGHVLGVGLQKSKNEFGHEVIEMLADYQGHPNGGNGWLRKLRFAPKENKIYVETYSTTLKKNNPNPKHTFEIDLKMTDNKPTINQ